MKTETGGLNGPLFLLWQHALSGHARVLGVRGSI